MKRKLFVGMLLLILLIGMFVVAVNFIEGAARFDRNTEGLTEEDLSFNAVQQTCQVFTASFGAYDLEGVAIKINSLEANALIRTSIRSTNSSGLPNATLSENFTTQYSSGDWINITLPRIRIEDGDQRALCVFRNGSTTGPNWALETNKTAITRGMTGYQTANAANGTWSLIGGTETNPSSLIFEVWGSGVIVTLDNPVNNSFLANLPIDFNSSVSLGRFTVTNATLNLWNSSNSLINDSVNNLSLTGNTTNSSALRIDSIAAGSYSWNTLYCGVNGTATRCDFASENFTLNIGVDFTGDHFATPITEGTVNTFQINFSLASGESLTSATLIQNETRRAGVINQLTTTDYSISSSFIQPGVLADSNVSAFWEILLVSDHQFNSTNNTQRILNIEIDDCTVQTVLILNYTLKDEGSQITVATDATENSTIELDVEIFPIGSSDSIIQHSQSYNRTNPAQVCVGEEVLNNTEFRLDSLARYESNDRVSEFHNVQNFSLTNNSVPQNINLFDLATTDSQEFLITFKDVNFVPIDGALIDITRKYIPEGVFKSVEVPKTNADGQALAHLVLSEVIYTIIVSKDGTILATFDNIVARCNNQGTGDCTINLNAFSSGIQAKDFFTADGITFTMTLNKDTRTLSSIFSTLDGSSKTVQLNATMFDAFQNTTVCSDLLTSSAGTLNCVIPESFENITVIGEFYSNDKFLAQGIFSLEESANDLFQGTRLIMLLTLYITLPLMMITSGIGVLLGAAIGFIIAGLLNIVDTGSLFAVGNTITWFLVAIIILIWKIARRNN